MDSLFSSELSLLGSVEGLREDGCGMGWPSSPLSEDMYPSSHFALAAAYHDIKSRLASLERENISIKHKLKNYEVKVRTLHSLAKMYVYLEPFGFLETIELVSVEKQDDMFYYTDMGCNESLLTLNNLLLLRKKFC